MAERNQDGESSGRLSRRSFLQATAMAGVAAVGLPAQEQEKKQEQPKPRDPDDVQTNIAAVKDAPRTETSMPGKYPGVVAEVHHPQAMADGKPQQAVVNEMLEAAMKKLTGEAEAPAAWGKLFSPEDRVGIKINPIGGRLLSNTHELMAAIIAGLESVGVPKGNMIIWDRRQEQMVETGFTEEAYPGIKCLGTEFKEGDVWKSEERLDKDLFYEFDIVGEYPEEVMPYHVNGGTKSYFTRILTQMVDKVINVPVLKNAGASVTLALKNLAYGVTSNTGRGHQIWNRYIAEVCAFPAVRDKVVLNIIDGLKGCFDGGPGAVAHYIWNANTIWAATDPVALDHMGWEKVFAKRIGEGIAWEDQRKSKDKILDKLVRAEKLGLGVYDRGKIEHRIVTLGRKQQQRG